MPIKIAFFSPLPPARSGIADYSAALLEELRRLADVEVFSSKPARFHPADFDAILYQIGNNEYHDFCYQTALEHPGVVVIHEANLHHLVAGITIKRGDWDAYMLAVEQEGGEQALAYAQRVRTLEIGPDYEGVPMLRTLLARSKAAVVHSGCVESELRNAGFAGPVARIPHGAWIPDASRMDYRTKLGLDESTPLIGIFGFLKPYKRIAESLRAFRRLLRVEPRAKMILVGEPHPELPLQSMIHSLDLREAVRVLGFQPIEEFVGYVAACDIVLNLRFPTVGENSGTLMRALGLGKAVIVSEVGSFSELPDDICLKAPVDSSEEDHLFEYLNLLVSRSHLRQALGAKAREWVATECSWPHVAERYVQFLEAVANGHAMSPSPPSAAGPVLLAELPMEAVANGDAPSPPMPAAEPPPVKERPEETPRVEVEPEYILSWAPDDGARKYIETHLTRLEKTLSIIPPGGPEDRILEMGSYLQITPALATRLGYGEVRGCYYGPAGVIEPRQATSSGGEQFACEIDLFDAEKDRFPYPGRHFSTVLCCELLEHLVDDPMRMMAEINRILKPGGHLVLTTPNISSLRAITAVLHGYSPGFFPAYIRPPAGGEEPEARHNREYTPREIKLLLLDSGFEVTLLDTGEFRQEPKPEHEWVIHMLERYQLPQDLRGDGIYAVGRKTGPVRERYPRWLYQ
ncbi:MAG TPA: glycosyltransferase [Bryobacteraceae bacterium]|nr:glycosyltransferase [Bryobacteraceae bacterium]